MMYTGQTTSLDNHHHKHNNRVLAYCTPDNSNVDSEATSLLACIREEHIDKEPCSLNLGQFSSKEQASHLDSNHKTDSKGLNLINGECSIESGNSANYIENNCPKTFNCLANSVNKEEEEEEEVAKESVVAEEVEEEVEEEEEEEEYELLQVVDSESIEESPRPKSSKIIENLLRTHNQTIHPIVRNKIDYNIVEKDCCHFTIEVKDDSDNIRISGKQQPSKRLPIHRVEQQKLNYYEVQDFEDSEEEDEEEVYEEVYEDEEEQFDYIVTRVPKRRRPLQKPIQRLAYKNNKRQHYFNIGRPIRLNNISTVAVEPSTILADSEYQSFDREVYNRNSLHSLQQQTFTRKRRRSISDSDQYYVYPKRDSEYTALPQYRLQSYDNSYPEQEYIINSPVVEEETAYDPIYQDYIYQDQHNNNDQRDPMVLDILNRIRNVLSLNSNSNRNTNAPASVNQTTQRKRRPSDDKNSRQLKYRILESCQSRIFHNPLHDSNDDDDDDIRYIATSTLDAQRQQRQYRDYREYQEHQEQFLLNPLVSSNLKSRNNTNILEMSNGHSRPSNENGLGRKSIFAMPRISQQLIKNRVPVNIDLELSDEEDDNNIATSIKLARKRSIETRPSCSNAMPSSIPRVFNVPIVQERSSATDYDNSVLMDKAVKVLPVALRLKLAENPNSKDHHKYNHLGRTIDVDACSENNINASTSKSKTFGSRHLNGYSQSVSSLWPTTVKHSVLFQEKCNEEREKYRQLLEQVAPREYAKVPVPGRVGSVTSYAGKNILYDNFGEYLSRSATMVAMAKSRHNASGLRTATGPKNSDILTKYSEIPLSSTINLDDDDDDNSTPLKNKKLQDKSKLIPTVIINDDNDDIKEIVDLGKQPPSQKEQSCSNKAVVSKIDLTQNDENNQNSDTLRSSIPSTPVKQRSKGYYQNWYDEWQAKWLERKKNLTREIEVATKIVNEITAQRRKVEEEVTKSLYKIQLADFDESIFCEDLEEAKPEVLELTTEQKQRIDSALRMPLNQVLISKFNLNITNRDIQTLLHDNWLNDEVINFYMNLLTDRGERKHDSDGLPTVYAMNTFFIPRLMQSGYAGVKRWTRKVDIFSKDVIPVPVHVGGVHWCMAIIHMKNQTIKYYDSMATPNPTVLKALEKYLQEESLDKRKEPFDTSKFQIESVQNVPRQLNGSDCGVFSCMFAEYITRNREITFTQSNMGYFRQKMIFEILQGELLQ